MYLTFCRYSISLYKCLYLILAEVIWCYWSINSFLTGQYSLFVFNNNFFLERADAHTILQCTNSTIKCNASKILKLSSYWEDNFQSMLNGIILIIVWVRGLRRMELVTSLLCMRGKTSTQSLPVWSQQAYNTVKEINASH